MKKKTTKKKNGRPKETIEKKLAKSDIDMERVSKLYIKGWTDDEVADFLGIAVRTLHRWKKDNEFVSPLKDWKDEADGKVERSLYERACGFTVINNKNYIVSDGKESGSHLEEADEKIQYPPDPTSCIFWLKNRKQKQWRDKNFNMNLNGDMDDETFCEEFFGLDFKKQDEGKAKSK